MSATPGKGKKIVLTGKIKRAENSKSDDLVDLRLKHPIEQEKTEQANRLIIEVLTQLVKQVSDENKSISDKDLKKKNNFRISSLWKAIQALKDHPNEIKSGVEAKQIKGIGQGIADRIDQILNTGTLPELEDVVNEETKAVDDLVTVSGIGEKTALRFYRDYGIKSVADLIQKWQEGLFKVDKHKLTHHIELGLKYYDDFKVRIPRAEVDDFYPMVAKYLAEIDSNLIFDIAGSYRRNKATTGDIDILISHQKLKTKQQVQSAGENYLSLFIEKLLNEGLLIDHLDQDFHSYYKGVILLKDIPRRIDIMIIPNDTYAAALMHSTGSGEFNKRIRTHAMIKGYHLSQHGLYKVIGGKKEEHPIPTQSEQEIFQILGVKWLKPEERD